MQKGANKKKNRGDLGQSLVAGRKPVRELLKGDSGRIDLICFIKRSKDRILEPIIQDCKKAKVRYRFVDKSELDRMFPGNHQGVVARTAAIGFTDLDSLLSKAEKSPLPLIVALDKVQDPGNVGVLARTAYALGAAGILTGKFGGAYLGAAAVRSSAGALTRLPVAKVTNLSRSLEQCADQGYTIYCSGMTDESGDIYGAEIYSPAVLVLGNEEKGVRPGVMKHCSQSLYIPMAREFDSLNVAQAGAIFISEFARRFAGK